MSCLQHLALINTRAHTHTHQAQESVLIGLKIMKPLRLVRLLRLLKVMKKKIFKARKAYLTYAEKACTLMRSPNPWLHGR
jgi:hypothetical protein